MFASYCIGYEDGQDAVEKLYSDFDLSSVVPPVPEDEAAEEVAPTQAETPTVPEVVHVSDATSWQRDKDDNES